MVERIIKDALKENKAILGYRESIKFLKLNKPKLVIIAENLPDERKKEIEHLCKISKVKLKIFKGSSKELGIICGKPFSVSVLVIKG
jgi:large subunit ribosomal protein L30e